MATGKYQHYKDMDAYKNAPKSLKRDMDEYMKNYHPSNDEMYLQLRKYELTHLDKKKRREPGLVFSLIFGVMAILFFFVIKSEMDNSSNPIGLLVYTAIMTVLCIGYYAGWFSKAKAEIRKINKELTESKLPEFKGSEK